MGQPFLDENSRIQVPFRITLESVGAKVGWDPITQTASAKKGDINIEIPIGEKYILRNGVKIDNDTKAVVKNGRTFLPIRVVMEALGYDVDWDGKNNIVKIDYIKINPERYLRSIAGVWHNPNKRELLFIDNDLEIYIGTTYNGIGDVSVLRKYEYELYTNSINVWYTFDDSYRWFYKEDDGSLTVRYNDYFKTYTIDKYNYIAPTISEANLILEDVIKEDKDLFTTKKKSPEDKTLHHMLKKLPPPIK